VLARDGFDSAKLGVVRVGIDGASTQSLQLLATMSHHEGVLRDTSVMVPLARRLSSEIASTVKAASASRGKVKFFFARGFKAMLVVWFVSKIPFRILSEIVFGPKSVTKHRLS
jgi:hypothetical protein